MQILIPATRLDRVIRTAQAWLDFHTHGKKPIHFLDVGALGGLQKRWGILYRLGMIQPIFFEPDPPEAELLSSLYPKAKIFQLALGSQNESATLHVTRGSGKSSLLEPDLYIIRQLEKTPEAATAWEVSHTVPVDLVRLDDVMEFSPEFMKIDVQGYELEVLKGSVRILKDVLAVEVETAVVPLYLQQPSHSEVTQWLLDHGFMPVATKTTGTFGGEGIKAIEYDSFFINTAMPPRSKWKIDIWKRINRLRPGGSWDLY
jgi:FkbM family methyltransferase